MAAVAPAIATAGWTPPIVGLAPAIVNPTAFDVAPSEVTVTETSPAAARLVVGTAAVISASLIRVVSSASPFQLTTASSPNPEPETNRVKPSLPAAARSG